MGCPISRTRAQRQTDEQGVSKLYNSFRSDDEDLSMYMYKDLDGEVVGKLPGQLKGEDFVISDCKNSSMYLLDYSAAVTIDDCSDCQIFIGPCKGSVFIRDCHRCVLMVSCQQLRTRDCTECTIYLHCTSQPVIEASSEMKFGCFQCHYPQLKDQFKSAGLSVFNNNWYSIHNFTPEIDDSWSLIRNGDESSQLEYTPGTDSELSGLQVSFNETDSVVPMTFGKNNVPETSESCLVVFFDSDDMDDRAMSFIHELQGKVFIVMSKEMNMTKDRLSDVFSKHTSLPHGQTIFMEVQGNECISLCAAKLTDSPANVVYSSPDLNQARVDLDNFFNLLDRRFSM